MNPILATYLGVGVVLAGLALLSGLVYLSGRIVARSYGVTWAEVSKDDRIDAMIVGTQALLGTAGALFVLLSSGYIIALHLGWMATP